MSYLSLANINFLAIAICFVFACGLTILLRLIVQRSANNLLNEELAQRDNFALGISYVCQIAIVSICMAYLFNDLGVEQAQQHSPEGAAHHQLNSGLYLCRPVGAPKMDFAAIQ